MDVTQPLYQAVEEQAGTSDTSTHFNTAAHRINQEQSDTHRQVMIVSVTPSMK